MEVSKFFIGSIKHKVSISDIVVKYHSALAMIAIVHNIGAKKYEMYSWINRPEKSNSTVKDNADALSRHFCAHSMGKFIDEEGLPHLFHMCCRAGMLVSTFYRSLNNMHLKYQDIRKFNIRNADIAMFITPEELTSLAKTEYAINVTKEISIPNTEVELRTYLQSLIFSILDEYRDFDNLIKKSQYLFDPMDPLMDMDILFTTVLRYAMLCYDNDIYQLISPKVVGKDIHYFISTKIHPIDF